MGSWTWRVERDLGYAMRSGLSRTRRCAMQLGMRAIALQATRQRNSGSRQQAYLELHTSVALVEEFNVGSFLGGGELGGHECEPQKVGVCAALTARSCAVLPARSVVVMQEVRGWYVRRSISTHVAHLPLPDLSLSQTRRGLVGALLLVHIGRVGCAEYNLPRCEGAAG
ncbi:hypothetical protein FA95DRAFT_333373 [Auriscalpium vulgare]|uniref:Uncharacterized protein n=1 Tax=Auriscalpium vulgare TaxID=40419 RepID=A0ACB8RJ44_9AGAM|nr:hypothetical protein FA95DRAFT_333373 [Auriscalpium vulgare]